MLRWLSDLITARREAAARRNFERGFEYAAGALLKSVDVGELEAECDFGFGPSAFDEGMDAAIVAWGQHFEPKTPTVWPEIAA